MELNLAHAEQGLEHLKIASHTLDTTYPLLHDPKMLLGVLENMHKAHEQLLMSVLEPLHKERIKGQSFIMQLKRFEDIVIPQHIIEKKELDVFTTVKQLVDKHEQTPLEFTRNDQLVMCTPDYELHTVNAPLLKEQLKATQEIYRKLLETADVKE